VLRNIERQVQAFQREQQQRDLAAELEQHHKLPVDIQIGDQVRSCLWVPWGVLGVWLWVCVAGGQPHMLVPHTGVVRLPLHCPTLPASPRPHAHTHTHTRAHLDSASRTCRGRCARACGTCCWSGQTWRSACR
jgi:hypothetical protein